ncbi:ABC-2 type transport system ATP-binding protein [Brevibacterium sandarakinum]|uniref:ABC-2 type transport system ATP-binding protein n=1 Tax=Brevibacterium sandarakinum TaxID=629680 RepID=A0A1H1V6L6_BRESA|nr:ATP-binding cassette domain-containing protein [Brevibacterium sandarakinum]SDS80260.1 ABC-2 type transport system ATP-binding protein [Brevibacterium sandarakinum]
MITFESLTKTYGPKRAVDDISLTIGTGKVTGFLGPNGAGKSTAMRMLLGLDRPTSGKALIGGRPYVELPHPLSTVGALLEPRTGHPGQSARSHLLGMARSNGIPSRRVTAVLNMVGLAEVARSRIGTFSLGMRQRLGIASALIGDPEVLIFDEPVNGLDPEGVTWIRRFMRDLAAQGRTVFVSSHLLSEMADTADHLVVIAQGRLVADSPLHDLLDVTRTAIVRSPESSRLAEVLDRSGLSVTLSGAQIQVSGERIDEIGSLAHGQNLRIDELSFTAASLEDVYAQLTEGATDHRSSVVPVDTIASLGAQIVSNSSAKESSS